MKLQFEREKIRSTMLCKICGPKETDNPDGVCDDCKFCIIEDKDIPPKL